MQQIVYFFLAFNDLSLIRRIILGSLAIVTLAVIVLQPYYYFPFVIQNAKRIILEDYQLYRLIPRNSKHIYQTTDNGNNDILNDELDARVEGDIGVYEHIISDGDTLSSILTQYDIGIADITVLAKQYSVLRNLKVGQSLSWKLTKNNCLQSVTWNVSYNETRIYKRISKGFKENIARMTGKWQNILLKGQLNGSFITSARMAGLTNSDINKVIKALKWQLDFRKLHKGDQFSVLTSREMINGKSTQSELLGVRLRTSGKDYYAFRANNGKFYNHVATGLVNGFMRFPTIKQFRVSSHFNMRRLNPVTGRVIPHRGVDFAMPIGTPVLAVGDGEVVVSKRDSYAGNHVAIRHDYQYMTRYMHLKKILVKPGQKVKRGECVAFSGNTGRSTGPHLHFEVWINQQAVNPLTAKLPCFEWLTDNNHTEYSLLVKQILPQLQFN